MPKPSAGLPTVDIKWLDLEEFEYLCFSLTRELMPFDEPIPDYSTCDTNLLDSALSSPKQTFDGKMLYPKFEQQAAILFYSLIKNHPFQNGNKRIAVMSLLVFLSLNHRWIKITPINLYKIARYVSESSREDRKKVIKTLGSQLKVFIMSED